MRRGRIIFVIALALIGMLSLLDHAGAFGFRGGDGLRYDGAVTRVTHAVDGDTIDVDIPDGRSPVTRIHLCGVDSPDLSKAHGETDAYFGRESLAFVRREFVGRSVRLALDPSRPTRDKQGRLSAYVYLDDTGEMLNDLLITKGLAYADRRFPHLFKHEFTRRERLAMSAKAGLWAGVTPEQLPAWRQRMDAAADN